MFDKLFKKKKSEPAAEKPKRAPKKTAKELATEKGEPYVAVLGLELDENDPSNGAFELDWNEKFVANLVRAGYQGKTDQDIVDQWFQNVCRHVVYETWEQDQAQRSNQRDLGNGFTEVS